MTENLENSEVVEQEETEQESPPKSDEFHSDIGSEPAEKEESSDEPDADPEDEELPLPEPDIVPEEAKKKKELPEWMKKKMEREQSIADKRAQEADSLREENARLKAAHEKPEQQQQSDPNLPQREAYNSDGEFIMAVNDYRDDMRQQQNSYYQQQANIQKHEKEFHDNLKSAIEGGKQKYKDFEEVTDYILYGDGFPSNRGMAEAIVESKYKDDVLYFLGTNVTEAERIAALNPIKAAKEIARLEIRFDSKRKSKATKAPRAIKPMGGQGSGAATTGDPGKMPPGDFENWYKNKFG